MLLDLMHHHRTFARVSVAIGHPRKRSSGRSRKRQIIKTRTRASRKNDILFLQA